MGHCNSIFSSVSSAQTDTHVLHSLKNWALGTGLFCDCLRLVFEVLELIQSLEGQLFCLKGILNTFGILNKSRNHKTRTRIYEICTHTQTLPVTTTILPRRLSTVFFLCSLPQHRSLDQLRCDTPRRDPRIGKPQLCSSSKTSLTKIPQ